MNIQASTERSLEIPQIMINNISAGMQINQKTSRKVLGQLPFDLQTAAQRAASSLVSGFSKSLNAISKGGIRNISSAVLQPAIGGMCRFSLVNKVGLGALANVTLGLRNMVDKSELDVSKEKYKINAEQKK